jgi:hypothetical protein
MFKSKYEDYVNKHQGETIIVSGTGSSCGEFIDHYDKYTVIGVNDICRFYTPKYRLMVDALKPPVRFQKWDEVADERFKWMKYPDGGEVFFMRHTPDKIGTEHPNPVQFTLKTRLYTNFEDTSGVGFWRTSPWVACAVAVQLGAKNIGMIGVDFTMNHYGMENGPHHQDDKIESLNYGFEVLRIALRERKIGFFNLSKDSRIDVVPKMDIDEFLIKYPGVNV